MFLSRQILYSPIWRRFTHSEWRTLKFNVNYVETTVEREQWTAADSDSE